MPITVNIYYKGTGGGTGEMNARLYMGENGKIIPCSIHPGGSIGMHQHPTSDDINYILAGRGKAICDGEEELLEPGVYRHLPLELHHLLTCRMRILWS